jgi:hypothetical protein
MTTNRSAHCRRRLLAIALGLTAAAAAPAPAAAQERLVLETFGDEALHRLGLKVFDERPVFEAEAFGGVEGALARGAATSPERPFAVTAGLALGATDGAGDLIQVRSQASLPLPFSTAGGNGPLGRWDVEGAHRIRARLALAGMDGDELEKGRGGVDLELEGALFQGGKYGTSFVRTDLGPYPFLDASGRATVAPRLAADKNVGLILPVAAEIHHVEVDRPEGVGGYTSERVSSGLGVRPFTPNLSHGWFEIVGGGWEKATFAPPAGAPRPRLGGAERIDLRFLHADGMVFSPEHEVEIELGTSCGGQWLHDPTGSAALSAFTGTAALNVRGYPDHDKEKEGIMLALGVGAIHDAVFLADGSAFTQRTRVEGSLESTFLDRRTGGSVRGAAEQLPDVGAEHHHPYRGAVAAEWFVSPIRPLELGAELTSTEQCVSPATAAGPVWCHRFGLFLRASPRWSREPKARIEQASPPPQPSSPPQPSPVPPGRPVQFVD